MIKEKSIQMKKGIALIFSVIFLSSIVYAQSAKKSYNRWSIGVHGGTTLFFGDISQYDWWPVKEYESERWNMGFGGNVGYQINPVWGLRVDVGGYKIGGTKRHGAKTDSPNNWVYFDANVFEYSLNATFNFMNLIYSDKTKERRFTYYMTGGVGFSNFRVKKMKLGSDEVVADWGYEGLGGKEKERVTETVFPLGAGMKIKLSKKFDIGLEQYLKIVNTEKLDATTGNTGIKDKYGYTALTLTYKIGKKEDAQEWVNPFEALNKNMEEIQANIDGLATDSDGDGVSDLFDKEANTPAESKVDGSGKAMDSDGDNVPDYLDADPFSNKGVSVDENGVELDTDGDGVADSKDLEPNTKAGAMVNFKGQEIKVESEKSSTSTSTVAQLPSVYFKVNSSQINYWSSYEALAEVAKAMKANPSLNIKVVGYCDRTGSEKLNNDLSAKRAEAVKDHLVKTYKIDAARLSTDSKGESENLAPTEDGKEMNVNRRVDFLPAN